ncbi:ribosomal protein S19 binding protein 1 [Danio aesculapii]|uniref:ribosomal protein S19 binding protein 1 n=1 Tax=Danio aesculapii TaxID=1142201 RepID=UPI0024BF30B6|nr:ribosomal protein S19 binding protein 1 [Danio aesculapii]
MSASVIRRGLELFSEKDGAKHKQKRNRSSKGALMEQKSTQKQRIQKRIRQLQRAGQSSLNNNTVKDKRVRSAVDEYRKKQKKSQLSSNLKYFLRTSSTTQKHHTAKEVQQSSSRRSCDQPDLPEPKPKETSVFTEQEFQTFQKEYFSRL